jgi:hemerythrin superfamily protein
MADGFDEIIEDHRAVAHMLAEFRATGDDALALHACEDLALHAAAEERALYPLLRRLGSGETEQGAVDDGVELVERAELEHAELGALTAWVLATPPPDLGEVMDRIGELVAEHVRFEEEELLPRLRPTVDAGELQQAFRDAKTAIRERAGTPLF